jgi:high-affinity K+ transport system ATPase subunit B
VVHGAVRQLRRGDGGRARQGPGGGAEGHEKDRVAKKLLEAAGAHGTPRGQPAEDLRKGDVVLVEAGDTIPRDGEVIEGVASVDESPSPANRPR